LCKGIHCNFDFPTTRERDVLSTVLVVYSSLINNDLKEVFFSKNLLNIHVFLVNFLLKHHFKVIIYWTILLGLLKTPLSLVVSIVLRALENEPQIHYILKKKSH